MSARSGRRKPRSVQVDRCGKQGGYILSIGPMSVWISARSGQEIVAQLTAKLSQVEEPAPEQEPEQDKRRDDRATGARRAN